MLSSIPLMLLPFILFNLIAFVFGGAETFSNPLFTADMLSGAQFSLTVADALIIVGVACLFVEILKATRTGSTTLTDHILSMLVFVLFLVEFITVAAAAQSVFLVLTVIAFIDVIAGFSVTIRAARRDIGYGPDDRL